MSVKKITDNEKINAVIAALVKNGTYKNFDELLEKARELVKDEANTKI